MGDDRVPLSHLFFADDSMYIGEWSIDNVLNLVCILFCFQEITGLKINLENSCIFCIGQTCQAVEAMAMILGYKAGYFPSIFLGMPIGVNLGALNPWKNLVNKFKSKLSRWKIRTLSIGGRHTLTSNVLGTLCNFLFSLFKVPKSI